MKAKGFHIYLTQAKAEALAIVFDRVGGCPAGSPRRLIDKMRNTLTARGVHVDDRLAEGSIYFKDTK